MGFMMIWGFLKSWGISSRHHRLFQYSVMIIHDDWMGRDLENPTWEFWTRGSCDWGDKWGHSFTSFSKSGLRHFQLLRLASPILTLGPWVYLPNMSAPEVFICFYAISEAAPIADTFSGFAISRAWWARPWWGWLGWDRFVHGAFVKVDRQWAIWWGYCRLMQPGAFRSSTFWHIMIDHVSYDIYTVYII